MSVEWSVMDSASAGSADATSIWSGWSDWAGMLASVGCAIHCAAMPFVIAYLPALGLSFLADEAFHQWMAGACCLIALTAFIPGLRKHGRLTPVVLGSAGLVMISVAAFGFAGECCAACESEATPVASVSDEACSDACCPHCVSEHTRASASVSSGAIASGSESLLSGEDAPAGSSPWLGLLAAWLTPLGGAVLVSAHLLNRRYGCLCGCCGDEAVRGAVLKNK